MSNTIVNNIKKQLNAKNMSAAELERRTGIPHAVVNILHGRSKNPSLKTAQAIAKELGCSLEELISDNPSPVATTTNAWNATLYKACFEAVFNCLQELKLQPKFHEVSEFINETYNYTLGSKTTTVDLHFVAWFIKKSLGSC
jgi:transcriptional regulator with XRE-family HTH domain